MSSTRHSCQICMQLEFSRQIFQKYSNIKFHENLSSRSRVPCDGQTDMKKLILAFRNFAKAPSFSDLYIIYTWCRIRRHFPIRLISYVSIHTYL
jgi:hypothetical protein